MKLRDAEPLMATVEAPKDLAMVGGELIPVPLSAAVCGVFPASSFTCNVAARAPLAVGVNVTAIVQELIFARVAPHVPPVLLKSPGLVPANVKLEMFSVAPLLLVSVTFWEALATARC